MPSLLRLPAPVALLLALAPLSSWSQAPTPRQLIDSLGVEIRQILEAPKPGKTPEDAERAVAAQISALATSSPGDDALMAADAQGRTPLMLAVSGAYPLVVKALLADPIVKARINARNAAGETAWMIASTAPAMTLMACQPAALTLERQPLLSPYLRRMSKLMATKKSVVTTIVQLLDEAGAETAPNAATQAWLARCPNASPELRQALAKGELLNTLVNDALERQLAFNKAYRAGLTTLPQRPPQGTKFVTPRGDEPLKVNDMRCPRMLPPQLLGALNWAGSIRFRAVIATRAGVVETVDFTAHTDDATPLVVIDHFRGTLIRTLTAYQCEGDHVFEQEFQFTVQ